jgi:hypothetical protein
LAQKQKPPLPFSSTARGGPLIIFIKIQKGLTLRFSGRPCSPTIILSENLKPRFLVLASSLAGPLQALVSPADLCTTRRLHIDHQKHRRLQASPLTLALLLLGRQAAVPIPEEPDIKTSPAIVGSKNQPGQRLNPEFSKRRFAICPQLIIFIF